MATLFAARDVIRIKPLERAVLAAWAGLNAGSQLPNSFFELV